MDRGVNPDFAEVLNNRLPGWGEHSILVERQVLKV
jgi:hypothetical protein